MSTKKEKKDKKPKAWKKLKVFFDDKKDASRRLKSIISFLDGAHEEPQEIESFFNAEADEIFSVFAENFEAYQATCKKEKGKYDAKELGHLITLMKAILVQLREKVAGKWQKQGIASFIRQLLYKENMQKIRVGGFELLLQYLDNLAVVDDDIASMLPAAINLNVFAEDYHGTITTGAWATVLEAGDRSEVLLPSALGEDNQLERSVQLLVKMLDFMGTHPKTFEFWFTILKTYFLRVFYPAVTASSSSMSSVEGFIPYCPAKVQDALADQLALWTRDAKLLAIIVNSPENLSYLWAFYRQGMALTSHFGTVRKFLHVYRGLCWPTGSPIKEMENSIFEYRKLYVEGLARPFQLTVAAELKDQHCEVCREILQLYRKNLDTAKEDPRQEEMLLLSLLNMVISGVVTNQTCPYLSEALADVAVETALFVWIRVNTDKPELWEALHQGISDLFQHSMAAIRQARNAITKLTITLRDMVYPAPLILKIPGKPGAPDSTPTTSSGDMSSTSDDHIKDTGTARRDTTTLRPAQAWTLETITQTWHNVLRIFDKINTIVDSNLHKEALQVVTDTMDLLLDAEISALYEELTDTSRPKPLELVDIFGPWLFEACALPNKYLAGKANAYATLGRLVCRHHHNRLPLSFMVHYYRILLQGLSEPENTQCTSEIIVYSSDIFALGFEGSSILIPAYLDAIHYILFGNPKPAPSALVQRKALTIVCSLICLTPHLQGVEIPLFTKDEHDKQTKFSCELAKEKVSTILCDTLSLPGSSQEMKIMCLWGLSVAIVEELAADHPSKASVEMWVERILSMTTFEDSAVVDSACDSLNTVSKTYDALMLLNPNLPLSVISTLICNVTNKMTAYAQTTSETEKDLAEKLVTKHLQVLLDWIILAPTDLFNDASRARALFEAIELCLFGQKLSASSSSLASSSPTASGESNQLTITPSSSSENIQPPPSPPSSSSAFTSFWAMFSSLHTSPSHRSQSIRMGAETLLFTLNNHFNLFPPKEGPVIMHSVLKEHEDEEETDMSKCLYYIWNGWSIISLQPLPPTDLPPPPPLLAGSGKSSKDGSGGKKKKKGGKKSNRASSSPLSSRSGSLGGSNSASNRGFGASPLRARIILRDPTGKYSWESCLAFDKLVPLVPVEACPSLFIPPAPSSSSSSSSAGKSSGGGEAPRTPKKSATYKRNKTVAPFYSAEVDESGIDKLEELLKYLGEKHTDCLPSYGNALNIPAPAEEQFQKDFRTYEQQLLVQAKEDRSGAFESLKKLGSYAIQPRAPTAPGWSPAFHSCRLLLSHLGFLAVEENENTFFQMPDITLVQANEKVRRSLSQLDKASVRELLKVGVIYVKEGQETQQVILRNDRESRSPLYTDFIESVAWTTRLKHHLGYLGGLDRILLSTGEDTPYYADHRLELILHDITSMPTDPEDRQQILKKRHVGNDIVHIVYSEHSRDYRPLTITSQFNDAHIVIYPLRNGLFRTQVFRKEKVALFGPVLDGMVLSKKVLGLLVRQTAINANQYVRNIMQGYEHPYPTRRRYVAEFAEKFSVGREDEANFLGEVWRRNEPKATISGGGAAGGGSLLQQSNSGISATGHITTVATPPGTPASSSASGSGSPVGAAMMAAAAVVGAAAASSSVASPLSSSASGTAVAQAAESKE